MKAETLAAICLTTTLLAVPACATQDYPGHLLLTSDQPGSDKGGLAIDIAPLADTFEADQQQQLAPRTSYDLFVDGQIVTAAAGSGLFQAAPGGCPLIARYLPAGLHHFALAVPGQKQVFETDGQVPGGGTLHILLYGPIDHLQAVSVSIPDVPSAGNEHIAVVNLLKSGQAIEVVKCVDTTTPCTPVSPALAMGDAFDAEFPAVVNCDQMVLTPGACTFGCSTLTNGRTGIGYQLVPTADLPNPPVNALAAEFGTTSVFFAAPVFISADGQAERVLN